MQIAASRGHIGVIDLLLADPRVDPATAVHGNGRELYFLLLTEIQLAASNGYVDVDKIKLFFDSLLPHEQITIFDKSSDGRNSALNMRHIGDIKLQEEPKYSNERKQSDLRLSNHQCAMLPQEGR